MTDKAITNLIQMNNDARDAAETEARRDTLMRRAADTLEVGASASDLALLADEIEAEAAKARSEADELEMASLAPGLSSAKAAEARKVAEDGRFAAKRLDNVAERVRSVAIEKYGEERKAKAIAEYQAADAEAEEAAKQLAHYPAIAEALATILSQANRSRQRIVKTNKDLPEGLPPLQAPEGRVREFFDAGDPGYGVDFARVRYEQAVIPHPTDPDRLLWPPVTIDRLRRTGGLLEFAALDSLTKKPG